MNESDVQLNDGLLARLQAYDRMLTAAEVAALLHCGRSTVHRMCEQRAIPFFKVGHLTRFHPARIAQWLIEQQGLVDFRKMMQREQREARRV